MNETDTTPFEVKEARKAGLTYSAIIDESENKRANAEQQLVEQARDQKGRKEYIDALVDTIRLESQHIAGAKKELDKHNKIVGDYFKSIDILHKERL